MGGGGLRILGHKKWHVWRRDNVERVLRDEREHEEKQRATRAEQRRRDQERRAEALGQPQPGHETTDKHINFFEQEEESHTRALLTGGSEHKKAHIQQERATLGRHARLPWYASTEANAASHVDERKRKRSAVVAQDCLLTMRPPRNAEEKEADEDEDARVRRRRDEKKRRQDERYRDDMAVKDKKKKNDKKRKHRHDDSKIAGKDDARELMERLRRERGEREAIERERAERLMRGH